MTATLHGKHTYKADHGRVTPSAVVPVSVTATPEPGIDYASPLVLLASTFLRTRAGSIAGDRRWYLDPAGALALLRLVRREPVLDVRLTGTPSGRVIRQSLRGRTLGVPRNRLCVAVWPVPAEVPARPSGNRHRAMRSALNTADRAGFTIRCATTTADRVRCAQLCAQSSPRLREWAVDAPYRTEQQWWVAEDAAGRLVGLAAVVVDAEWASLVTLIGVGDGADSAARFTLHHAITRALADLGVRYLAVLDDSPLLSSPGTRHIQRVLGYRLARLRRPTSSPRSAGPVGVTPGDPDRWPPAAA